MEGGQGGRGRPTFLSKLFHSLLAHVTVTVLSMNPDLITTPCFSRTRNVGGAETAAATVRAVRAVRARDAIV